MMKDQRINRCRKCGRPIGIITEGIYRKVVVDAEAVEVIPSSLGEEIFIRIDGSKVRGLERVPLTPIDEPTDPREVEYVYRPHRKTCGIEA